MNKRHGVKIVPTLKQHVSLSEEGQWFTDTYILPVISGKIPVEKRVLFYTTAGTIQGWLLHFDRFMCRGKLRLEIKPRIARFNGILEVPERLNTFHIHQIIGTIWQLSCHIAENEYGDAFALHYRLDQEVHHLKPKFLKLGNS